MNFLFVFDEARSLLKNDSLKSSLFLQLRRALWHFPTNSGAFSVVLDTISRISNFQPASMDDPSQRARHESHALFEPFYILSTTDVMVAPATQAKLLDDVIEPKVLYRYGRPLWGAQLDAVIEDLLDTQLSNLVVLAKEKLVGGGNRLSSLNKQNLNETIAIAILGPRIGLDVSPQSQLASELVASHMRSCAFISSDRQSLITMFPIEPILSEASAQLIYVHNISLVSIIEKLISSVRNG